MNNLFERIALLRSLPADRQAKWGIMSPHHMIEHLSGSMRMSNGKVYLPQLIADEKIPARLEFLYSDKPFPRDLKFTEEPASLKPLKTASMEEAIALLEQMLVVFEAHYEANPNDKPIHPFFGPLNKEQWLQFHNRHWNHHFEQFDLM
ncbi:MAG: DUF1569 domain-containing protein [Sphingobacteriaceae bacterium]|nr:DUF1569 domain-containing protein [Sphingobacteriaceae bacterium]